MILSFNISWLKVNRCTNIRFCGRPDFSTVCLNCKISCHWWIANDSHAWFSWTVLHGAYGFVNTRLKYSRSWVFNLFLAFHLFEHLCFIWACRFCMFAAGSQLLWAVWICAALFFSVSYLFSFLWCCFFTFQTGKQFGRIQNCIKKLSVKHEQASLCTLSWYLLLIVILDKEDLTLIYTPRQKKKERKLKL